MNNTVFRIEAAGAILVGLLLGTFMAWEKLSWAAGLIVLLILAVVSFKKMEDVFWAMIFFLPFTRIGVLELGRFSLQPSQILTLCITLSLMLHLPGKKKGI